MRIRGGHGLVSLSIVFMACNGAGDDDPPTDASARDAGADTTPTDGGPPRDAGPRDGGYVPIEATVVLNEIMYHPPDTAGLAEFVEIHNATNAAVDLGAWRVSGFGFTFPDTSIQPGAYLVIAEDAAGFEAAYGFAPDFVADGNLRNSGEEIQLRDRTGEIVDRLTFSDRPPWPPIADGEGPSLELVDPSLDRAQVRSWRAGGPTPRAVNSVAQREVLPWVESVTVARSPAPDAPIAVSAQIEDATAANLVVRIGFDVETTQPMTAAGTTFTAQIAGQPAGTLVRYRVEASGDGGAATFPRAGDTVTWDGTVVADASVTTQLPVLQWFMAPDDYQVALESWFLDDLHPAAFYIDGVFFDAVRVRIKGDSSRQNPKNHWKVKFPRGHLVEMPEYFPVPVDQFNLQSSFADKTYLRDVLAYRTWGVAGMPSNAAFSVRVQQNGEFYGLYACVEDIDRDFLVRHGIDDEGAFYEANADGSAMELGLIEDYYEKGTRLDESHQDLVDFLSGVNDPDPTARRTYLLDNLDVPTMINYLAVNVVLHNNDQVAKNYYLHRDTLGTERWRIQPWDMDLTFGRNSDPYVLSDNIMADDDAPIPELPWVSPSHPLFGDRDHQKWDEFYNRITDAMHGEPMFRQMFYRRLRTLMDRLLAPGVYEQWIDELSAPLSEAERLADFERWGTYGDIMTHADAVAQITDDYLPRRRTHLFTTHRVAGEIPEVQSAAPNVVINEIHFAPVNGDAEEFVELFNPSTTEAIDVSGWRIEALGVTVPPGTVILPEGYAIVVGDDRAFRAARGGGRFVPAEIGDAMNDAGETLELVDGDGRVVDRVAFTGASPWPDVSSGASIELVRHDSDHAAAASWRASASPGGTPGARNSASP